MSDHSQGETEKNDKELDASFEIPAHVANRFFIVANASGVRISFGEQSRPDTLPRYRAAVYLSHEDAAALRDLLSGMLGNQQTPVQDSQPNADPKND